MVDAFPIVCAIRMAKTILIADDNENDAFAINATLKRAGINNSLMMVSDGSDVIAYFKGDKGYGDRTKFPRPSVLLLDLKMPRIGGFAVLEWLREKKELENLLVIVLTGHGELENLKRAYELGARSFLVKPCSVEDVGNLVRAYSMYWETSG